ncbi:MAG: FprA family A-type flavoprotein [Candidatus Wallbacteria bacterium]|nr:FprA family A-type flavoprotein [Candidatus Wallbacteria bacterium]
MADTFKAVRISDRVWWVGAVDWGIRDFHGYATKRGTTYNAYLVTGDKPVLIDTVKKPFYQEMMSRISSVLPEKKVSFIISNHSEMDHSGSLPEAIASLEPEMVFASRAGCQALKDHFPALDSITAIKSGEKLALGNSDFLFLETRMLHWPDSMVSYLAGDGVLFTQDAFGMHLATLSLMAAGHERALLRAEAARYYANILTPYSGLVADLLQKLPQLGLDIKIVAPDHGPIWQGKDEIGWITGLWQNWAALKPTRKTVIVYDSMWGSTASMAQVIADSLAGAGVEIFMAPLSSTHRSDVATELLEAGALLVGTPTINQEMFPTVADVLCYLKGLKRKGLIGQVFGSHGWGGEGVRRADEALTQMQVETVGMPVTARYVPGPEALSSCRELGAMIASALKERTAV